MTKKDDYMFMELSDIDFEFRNDRFWYDKNKMLETSEFSDDGSIELINWRDYCIQMGQKHNNIVAVRKVGKRGQVKYSIVEVLL